MCRRLGDPELSGRLRRRDQCEGPTELTANGTAAPTTNERLQDALSNNPGSPVGVSGMHETQPAERHLADVATDLRVLGSRQGVPGKVVAQLMGHTNADVTIHVYTQVLDASLRTAVDRIGGNCSRLFTKRKRGGAKSLI